VILDAGFLISIDDLVLVTGDSDLASAASMIGLAVSNTNA